MQYNTIQRNTMQCNTIQCNAIQCTAMQCNTIQCNTIQYNAMQYNTMQCNTIQDNAIQCNAIQYNTIYIYIQYIYKGWLLLLFPLYIYMNIWIYPSWYLHDRNFIDPPFWGWFKAHKDRRRSDHVGKINLSTTWARQEKAKLNGGWDKKHGNIMGIPWEYKTT